MSWYSLAVILIIAGVANMTPVLVKKLSWLDYSIDGDRSWRGVRVLGNSKTWRGLVCGVLVAVCTGLALKIVSDYIIVLPLEPLRGGYLEILQYSAGIGCAALVGDLIKSFFKRRIGMVPGKSWIPFDQVDWVVGVLIFLIITGRFDWNYLYFLVIGFGLHLVVKWIGWLFKIETKAI